MKNLKYYIIMILFNVLCISCQPTMEEEKEIFDPKKVEISRIYIDNAPNSRNGTILKIECLQNAVLPDEIYLDDLAFTDNGAFLDEIANDGIYTSIKSVIISNDSGNRIAKSEIGCKFDFSGVGEECNGQVCPEKSILGGSTWFCVCLWDCSFKIEF